MAYKHLILTRFNAGLYSKPDKRKFKKLDAWMEHRISLFENFTLPSIMNQSCQNFSWRLLVDTLTPKKFIRRIENFGYSNIKICYTGISIYSRTLSDAQVWGIDTYKHDDFDILTSRIDNDDAFHVNYVKEIQNSYTKLVNKSKPFVISFPLGYDMDLKLNRIRKHNYRTNNCLTLVVSCNKQDFRSVFCYYPPALMAKYRTFPIRKSEPYWLIIIHSQNLGNQKYRKGFTDWDRMKITDSILARFGIKI